MSLRPAPLDLRGGARVRWHPAHSDEWREGTLVRPSPTNEEWLVRADDGQQYWIYVARLQPP